MWAGLLVILIFVIAAVKVVSDDARNRAMRDTHVLLATAAWSTRPSIDRPEAAPRKYVRNRPATVQDGHTGV